MYGSQTSSLACVILLCHLSLNSEGDQYVWLIISLHSLPASRFTAYRRASHGTGGTSCQWRLTCFTTLSFSSCCSTLADKVQQNAASSTRGKFQSNQKVTQQTCSVNCHLLPHYRHPSSVITSLLVLAMSATQRERNTWTFAGVWC